jgi:hypothetical protein
LTRHAAHPPTKEQDMVQRTALMQLVRQPASAAIAGIIFALILGVVIWLFHDAAPDLTSDLGLWAGDPGRKQAIDVALNLIPFAGIAFLWFLAVLRSQVGANEDRFVGTVFLGSGLLFIGLLFTARQKAVLSLQTGVATSTEARALGWTLALSLLGLFGARMAAVFVATVATVGRRSGSLPAWLTVSGYVVALLLLVTPPLPTFGQYLFPGWVLVLSGYLLTGRHHQTRAA